MIAEEDALKVEQEIIQLKNLKTSYVNEKIGYQSKLSEYKDLLKGNEQRRPELVSERNKTKQDFNACELKIANVNLEIKQKRKLLDEINDSLRTAKKIGSSEGLRSELTELKVRYQNFSKDLTRVASMRTMAAKFAQEVEVLIDKYY